MSELQRSVDMTIGRGTWMVLAAAAILLGAGASVAAQTNDEVFPQFQWNFAAPGARANGMGRVFVGIADDATATVSNPAGLVNLTRPQVYVEYKNTHLKVDRLAATDSLFTRQATTFSTDINALSFITISTPFKKRFAAGFTRHQYLNYQETFHLAPRAIPGHPYNAVLFPVNGSVDFKGVSYGFTIAAAASPRLDVGLTLFIDQQLSANSRATRNQVIVGPSYPEKRSDLTESAIKVHETSINETATAASVGIGVLFKPSDKLSIGVNYVSGPKYTVSEHLQTNPGFSSGTNLPLVEFSGFPKPVHINVPNRLGVGIAARPNPRLLVGADVVRINYSILTENFTLTYREFDRVNGVDLPFLTGAEFAIDDVTEVHLGAEYNLMTGSRPVFVRAGIFTNPNHAMRFLGYSNSTLPVNDVIGVNASENALYNTLPRDTQVKGTIGAGIALGQRLQLDLAYVFGSEFVASAAFRFK
jgi:long-subunit fatty acid transport protein